MKPYQEEMDKYERSIQMRNVRGICLGIAALGLFFLIAFYQGSGKLSDVTGTVVGLTSYPSQYGHNRYLIVQLDSGPTVEARIGKSGQVMKGKKVLLKQTTKWFGFKKYHFMSYLIDPLNPDGF